MLLSLLLLSHPLLPLSQSGLLVLDSTVLLLLLLSGMLPNASVTHCSSCRGSCGPTTATQVKPAL